MTGNFNYNNVKCSKCGHDQNPANARKCEICGNPLKKALVPPFVYVGLAALLTIGGSYFAFKDKLTGKSASESTANALNTTVPTTPQSEPITTEQPTVQEIQPTTALPIAIDTSLPDPAVLSMEGSTTMVTLIQRLRNAYALHEFI